MSKWSDIVSDGGMDPRNKPEIKIPQDVEEFIAAKSKPVSGMDWSDDTSPDSIDDDMILTCDLRAWMTGRVRVPVEPTEAMIEAGCKQHECQQQDSWYSNDELSEYDCIAIYKAMLNASKAEGK